MGLSGAPLENDMGVCIEDVEDSSSPAMSSCGLEAVGVVEGDTLRDEGRLIPAELDEKLRNMARIESALAGFWRPFGSFECFRLLIKSEMLQLKVEGMARSQLEKVSLP